MLPWLLGGLSTAALVAVLMEVNALKKETQSLHKTLDASTQTLSKANGLITDLWNRPAKVDTVYLARQEMAASPLLDALGSQQKAYRAGYRAALKDQKYLQSDWKSPGAGPYYNGQSKSLGQNANAITSQKIENSLVAGQAGLLLTNSTLTANDAANPAATTQNELQLKITDKEVILGIDSLQKQPVSSSKPPEKPAPFRWANLKPRLGIETAVNLQHAIGIGPLVEFQLNQYLSLAFGVLATQGANLYFDDEHKFEEKMRTTYKSIYGKEIGNDPGEMREIEIYTSYVELPVRFKYYVPIKGKFSLVPFAGTHFDLSATERVKCERYFGSTDEHYSFTKRQKTTFFHTYTFGLGAQWKNEKTIWQITPFYTYNFRQSTLYENANLFGISLSLWFPLLKP